VGAGPTGLVLALWLSKFGIGVRIIDKLAASGTTSRALAVQARTLELYQQFGLSQAVLDRGHKVAAMNLWVKARPAARIPLENLGQGLTPFPFPIIFPQDEHETLLIERLKDFGVQIERQVELVDFEDSGAEIRATLRRAGEAGTSGGEEVCGFAYLAGCDGARSRVREVLGAGFPGGTYDHLFYVADIDAVGPPMNGELHVDLDDADFLAVFPLQQDGKARLIGSVRDDAAKDHEHLEFENVRGRAMQNLRIEVKRVNWFSTYRVHHRVTQQFRKGRAFLLGDAAHIHSPVGGQGMNTGIGDAVNLAWKLARSLKQPQCSPLLDSYEPERIAFARQLVATTDRAFTAVISDSALARFVRTKAIPAIAPGLFRRPAIRRFVFRTVSQISVNYRGGPLSRGAAGKLRGGDRLPWVEGDAGEEHNFAALTSMDWQMHVYGDAAAGLQALADSRNIPLRVFHWNPHAERAGLKRNASYLIRPDGYIGLADSAGGAAAIGAYLDERHL
jgi:2-polyprenyl-6-methoxyphenol hydroxylase-like FAD-dependent oxidoreductase